ncbi:protocadherin-16-like [Penaeus japonicus]|uniref:protocadherin-16-like n=1 Tax=Penaeus japonicus TaxID=27405 RepID=UPI001C711EF5|nr:protocadherin-16-like [Penaeus japonicus]
MLQLTSELDFENQQQLTCTLRAQDKGNPPLTSDDAVLTITVLNRPDEPPVFDYRFYYSILDSSMAEEILDVQPEAIKAEDAEGTAVTYTMENARADGNVYFCFDVPV